MIKMFLLTSAGAEPPLGESLFNSTTIFSSLPGALNHEKYNKLVNFYFIKKKVYTNMYLLGLFPYF